MAAIWRLRCVKRMARRACSACRTRRSPNCCVRGRSLRSGVGQSRQRLAAGKALAVSGDLPAGLTNGLTGYGGLQAAKEYQAVQLGAAFGTSLGAVGFDVTQSASRLNRERRQSGQSYRLSYSKVVNETNSSLSLAAYRFSTSGYMDLMTAMQTRERMAQGEGKTPYRAPSIV